MPTTTNLSTLKINYLTQAQYDTAVSNNTINENEIYLTPSPAVMPITAGGTGAVNASGARTNLGLGTIATHAEGDYVTTSGNAASATYASNIRVTQIAPTNNTGYCLTMTESSTANTNYAPLVHPNAARVWTDANDTDGITKIALHMGNATIPGALKLFDGSGKAINIETETVTGTGNRVITLPDANGTILTTAGGQTVLDTLTVDTSTTSNEIFPIAALRNAPGTTNACVGVKAENTGSGLRIDMEIGSGGKNHGIYSSGYYDGTTYTADGSWLVYRNQSGKIYFNIANNGNVVISNQGRTLFITTSASVPSGAKAGDIVLVKA